MSNWTLTLTPVNPLPRLGAYGASTTKTFAEWGISSAELTRASLATDNLIIETNEDSSLFSDSYSYKDRIEIFKDSVRFFTGYVITTPRHGNSSTERQTISVAGPWWWLEQITFQELWLTVSEGQSSSGHSTGSSSDDSEAPTLSDSYSSRILLGMNKEGNLISTGQQISAILTYARDQWPEGSAPFDLGTILTGQNVWTSDQLNSTCAEIVRTLMRWHPDCASHIDYSSAIPTLSIQESAYQTTHTKDVSELTSLSWHNRDDLRLDGVILKYEKEHVADGKTYVSHEIDKYPSTATNGPNVVIATIPLRGSSRTTQKQQVTTRSIPTESSSVGGANPHLNIWWREQLPWLKVSSPASANVIDHFEIANHEIQFARIGEPSTPIDSNAVDDSDDASDYPRELLSGGIADWMECKAARLLVKCDIIAKSSAPPEVMAKFKGLATVGLKAYPSIAVEVEIQGTDAISKTYSKIINSTSDEPTPENLAQRYYEAHQTIRSQGSCTISEDELTTASISPGDKITITASGETNTPASSVIQQVAYDIGGGKTSITFGPPSHLSPQDFIEALRMARALPKAQVFSFAEKAGLSPTDANVSLAPEHTPKTNTTSTPEGSDYDGRGFEVKLLPENKVSVGNGFLFCDGDPAKAEEVTSTNSDSQLIGSGGLVYWAVASSDKDGKILNASAQWLSPGSVPPDLQRHRQEKTNSEEDTGQEGKYAWKVVTVLNNSGAISWIRHLTSIDYYSDRSAKNWSNPQPTFTDEEEEYSQIPVADKLDWTHDEEKDCYKVRPINLNPIKYREKKLKRSHPSGVGDDDEIFSVYEIKDEDYSEPPVGSVIADLQACMHPGSGSNNRIYTYDSSGKLQEAVPIETFTNSIQTDLNTHKATRHPTSGEYSKLTSIEEGAEVNPTGSEIKTAYEGESNTNAFTDAEKSKLASVDATSYGSPVQSETALAALTSPQDKERRFVENELSDYFFDSSANSGDVSPSDGTSGFWRKVAVGGESASSLKTKYESNADTNAFTNTQQTKLAALSETHQSSTTNPHSVTKAQVGLGLAENTADADKEISTLTQAALDTKASATSLADHQNLSNNPHSVTKDQIGLGNVENTTDAAKEISTLTQAALDAKAAISHTHAFSGLTGVTTDSISLVSTSKAGMLTLLNVEDGATADQTGSEIKNLYESQSNTNAFTDSALDKLTSLDVLHQDSISNPHSVTKAQVGLGNVDNVSDQLKPISTSVQNALDLKSDITTLQAHENRIDNPHGVNRSHVGLGNVDNVSDLDKEISTLTQAALDGKASLSHTHTVDDISDITTIGADFIKTTSTGMRSLLDVEEGSRSGDLSASDINTISKLNSKITDGNLISDSDDRLTNARQPSSHTHTVDDISDITTTGADFIKTTSAGMRSLLDVEEGSKAGDLLESDINTLSKLNSKITDAVLIMDSDSRLSDERDPTAHTHVATEISDSTDVGRDLLKATLTSAKQILQIDNTNNIYIPSPPTGSPTTTYTLKVTSGNITWQA